MKTKKLEELELLINDVKSGENKYCVIFHDLDGSYTHDYDVIIYRFNKIVNCTSAKLILKDNLEPALAFYNEGKEVGQYVNKPFCTDGEKSTIFVKHENPDFSKEKYRIKQQRPKMPFIDWKKDSEDSIFAIFYPDKIMFLNILDVYEFGENYNLPSSEVIVKFGEQHPDAYHPEYGYDFILVNGFAVPKTLESFKAGEEVFYCALHSRLMYLSIVPLEEDCIISSMLIASKVAHSTKENAIKHAKAMLGINPDE